MIRVLPILKNGLTRAKFLYSRHDLGIEPQAAFFSGVEQKGVEAVAGKGQIGLEEVAFSKPRLYGLQEFFLLEWFGQVIVGPLLHALANIRFIGFCAQKNKGDRGGFGVLGQGGQNLVPVNTRHHDVAENQVGLPGKGQFKAFFPVWRGYHIVMAKLEQFLQVFANFEVVFNNEDLVHRKPLRAPGSDKNHGGAMTKISAYFEGLRYITGIRNKE